MKFFSGYDFGIVISAILLNLISLVVISSIDVSFFRNQLVFSLISFVGFFIFSAINIKQLKNLSIFFYASSILLLSLAFFFGSETRGAKRWIEVFGITIQFSELVKPFLILAFASLLSLWKEKIIFKNIIISVALFLPIAFILFRQPDLGNMVIYSLGFLFMLLSAGMNLWYLVLAILFIAISFPIVWKILADYQRGRIVTFINPGHDPLGIGYNAIQSTIAVGSGLLFGRGLGRGVQSQLQFLPERHTDFIFATFSEEFGFLGSLILLIFYFILLYRILQIARKSQERFDNYVVLGVFSILLFQMFINIGMNIGIVPITGVTLPLVSYGGSSLVSTMIMLGIVNSIGRTTSGKRETLEIR